MFIAKKTKEMEPPGLCGCPCPPCISTISCEKLLEAKIKDRSRGSLARCEIPGDKWKGKKRLKGKERKCSQFPLILWILPVSSQEVDVDAQSLKESALGMSAHSVPCDGNHYMSTASHFFLSLSPWAAPRIKKCCIPDHFNSENLLSPLLSTVDTCNLGEL